MKKLLFLLVTSLHFHLSAQVETCGFDLYHQRLLQTDSNYTQHFREQTEEWVRFNQQKTIVAGSLTDIYEIPVVVHIMHSGEPIGDENNPLDSSIQNWIDYFNEVYAAQFAQFPDTANGGVFIPIRLKLAMTDPQCNPTNGINRINVTDTYPNYTSVGMKYLSASGISDTAIKALSYWPRESYYNIWLVNKIDNGNYSGFATPAGSIPYLDGAVMDQVLVKPTSFNYPTFPHEVGHSLGLLHTFQGGTYNSCAPNADCLSEGDQVCDTDPHFQLYNCPADTVINSCMGTVYNGLQNNIMSYFNCRNRFTVGQRDKMVFTLLNYRGSLLSSYATLPPDSTFQVLNPPLNLCVPSAIQDSENNFNVGIRRVKLADMLVSNNGYTNDNYQFYIDHTIANCIQPQATAHIHIDSSYTIQVTSGPNPETIKGWIDFNNDGTFSSNELVISYDAPPTGNVSYHESVFSIPQNAITCTPLRMRIASDIFPNTVTPCSNPEYGQTEDFIVMIASEQSSVSVDVMPNTVVPSGTTVTFQSIVTNTGTNPAYRWLKNGQMIPGVYGPTWIATGGVDFLSGDVISLKVLSNNPCILPETISGEITMELSGTVGITNIIPQNTIKLYPNPTQNTIILDGLAVNTNLQIENLQGQIIYSAILPDLKTAIDLSSFETGIYLFRLTNNLGTEHIIRVLKQR